MRELTLNEMEQVSGADVYDDMQDWGMATAATGGGMAAAGIAVTQLDSPLPGPADAVGGAMVIFGAGMALVGGVVYAGGSIAGAIDEFFS